MIFEDSTKKNWKRAGVIFIVVLIAGLLLVSNIIFGFVTTPSLFQLRPLERDYGRALPSSHLISSEVGRNDMQHGLLKSSRKPKKISLVDTQTDIKFFGESFLRTAFVLQDDEKSIDDLKQHISDIDIVFPNWFSIASPRCEDMKTTVNSQFQTYLSENKKSVFPRFSNTNSDGVWKRDEFMTLIKDDSQGECLIASLKNNLQKNDVDGINLDIENLEPDDREFLSDWLVKLVRSFHQNNLAVTIDLPVNDNAFDYEFIGNTVDRVVLMSYDEHYAGSTPGPIASKEWFENALNETLQKIPKQKLIVALGNYAYDWTLGSNSPAKPLGFADAMMLAKKVGADVETDRTAINSYFLYTDDQGHDHAVWLLDAVSFWNSYHFIGGKDVSGISFWRLGLEDPGIWKFFGKQGVLSDVLSELDALDTVIYEGEGQLYKVTDLPTPGSREMTTDEGYIDYAQYVKIPTPYVVEKFFETHKPQVLFTFDDGPDPIYTPEILSILKKYSVSAIFFMVGDQIERYPDVAREVAQEGHFIGNHTFNHPNISDISDARLRLELNSTQRFIESTTGRSTILFRAPYDTDADPTLPTQLKPLYTINTLGYTAVGGNIDSSDYKKPGVDYMIADVLKQLDPTTLNIVVMHDAGGDRTQTVAALEKLIPAIRVQGYDITSLDKLLGITKNSIMPRISFGEQMVVWGNSVLSFLTRWGWGFIASLFFLTTIISIFRVVYLGYFVFRGKNHTQKADLHFMPPVTVLIPAYNEEKVIERTLQKILKSHYEALEILVINDGSTDETAHIVREIAKAHPQVKLISKENGGKWTALNLGFQKAKHEFIVTIDADTLITLNTIKYLVAPFIDESIDAVCGNIEVGNVRNILTAFQEVEYITSQNYDRRAFDELNCISVVPGATGSWRKSKILAIGGYSGDTLTEDADLTLTLLSQGGKIVYSSQAKSITEAPETVSTLYKQRFRWTYGTFQCLWKHRKLFGKGSVGWVAIPNMFLFQVVFPILSPLGDLVFLLALIRGDSLPIIVGYITFLTMDLAGTLIALTLEQKSLTKSWVVLIQRFFYRQFMYVITYRSIIASLRGNRHGWNKLDRTANMKE